MAFGHKMQMATFHGQVITLQPIKRDDLHFLVEGMSSLAVTEYTAQTIAQTIENEYEWYDALRKSTDTRGCGIYTDDKLIGMTSIHHIDQFNMSCTSGIVISNKEYHGKGIGTTAHGETARCEGSLLI